MLDACRQKDFNGGMGAFLLSAGEKGKRFCLPNSKIMSRQAVLT